MGDWFVRSLVYRFLYSGEEERKMDELHQKAVERQKAREAEARALSAQKHQEYINAIKYSDQPVGAWYVYSYRQSSTGETMMIPMPEAVTKNEWLRRFHVDFKRGNGVLPYRTMLDGWNPEWGDIHEGLASEAHFYDAYAKSRYHSNPSKEFDRLLALPYDVKDYDPLLKATFKYNSPLEEWEELERVRQERKKREFNTELCSTLLAVGVIVAFIALFAAVINGTVGKVGFVILTVIIVTVVGVVNNAIHKQ